MAPDYILTSVDDGVRTIKFSRPNKKNAWVIQTYTKLINILSEDALNDSVTLTIMTGVGDYYSSGQDFFLELSETETYEDKVVKSVNITKDFVNTLINYPKLLIAVVNGPAVGFAVTTLALCDVVYASDRATFTTPFVRLAVCPEACSSYLFPRIMGPSKASKMLLLGQKITAQEAFDSGLVAEIVPHKQLDQVLQRLRKFGKLPLDSVRNSKRLIRSSMQETLRKINEGECDALVKCLLSDEFMHALMRFGDRSKSKL